MKNKISSLEVNDIFDELSDESQRLKQCLKVFIELKKWVDLILVKVERHLDFDDLNKLQEVLKNVELVSKTNDLVQRLGLKEDNDLKENKVKLKGKTVNKSVKPKNHFLDAIDEANVPRSKVNGIFVCNFIGCGKVYATKRGLKVHGTVHSELSKRFLCDVDGCDYRTSVVRDFQIHGNTHKADKPYKCGSCPKTFASNGGLEIHMKTNHKRFKEPLVCGVDDCNKKFDNEFRLNFHRKIRHFAEKRFICDFPNCKFRCFLKNELKIHENTHRKDRPFICETDDTLSSFKTNQSFERTQVNNSSAEDTIDCPPEAIECNENTDKEVDKSLKCSLCSRIYKSKKTLDFHLSTNHKSYEEQLICGIDGCKKIFRNRIRLNFHRKAFHLNEKRFCCDFGNCSFKTSIKSKLKAHKTIHSDERPFSCDIEGCLMRFRTNSNLKLHLLTHSRERNFKCLVEGCHKSFKTSTTLNIHSKCVHPATIYSCSWPGCDFKHGWKSNINRHYRMHSDERQFLCDWPECHKTFKFPSSLNYHKKTHRNERPYACFWPGCEHRFFATSALKKHIKFHQK